MKSVAKSSDVTPGSAIRVKIDGVEVCVARTETGELHAIDDLCTHGEVSLSEGDVIGCAIECWLHGSTFDLRTGEPQNPPAFDPVAVYECTERDGEIYVKL